MPQLPVEIWLLILKLVPEDNLQQLYAVNHLFFEQAMDIRYKDVAIPNDTEGTVVVRKLLRLQDPRLGQRVRRVHISTFFRKSWWKHAVWDDSDLNNHSQQGDMVSRLVDLSSAVTNLVFKTDIQKLLRVMTLILSSLPRVEEFSVESWPLPLAQDLDICPLIMSTLTAISATLRTLTITGSLKRLEAFLRPPVPFIFPVLRHVMLELTDNGSPNDTEDSDILRNIVAPLINSTSPQLQSLRLTSWASIELSTFLGLLGHFPQLQRFMIRAAFNTSFRSDVLGLSRFISGHRKTLQSLSLRLNPARSTFDPSIEQSLSDWLGSMADGSPCTVLRHFEVYPSTLSSGLDATVQNLRCVSSTLTRLCIRDRYLTLDEVDLVMGSLANNGRLQRLQLNVRMLSVDLLELLAMQAPALEHLDLAIGRIRNENETTQSFLRSIKDKRFNEWKLYELGVWQGGAELDSIVMEMLGRCIPSVRTFWGRRDVYKSS